MSRWADALLRVESALPEFADGQRKIEEWLESSSFDEDGSRQRWAMFDRLSEDAAKFLGTLSAEVREVAELVCELLMCQLKESVERTDRVFECYRSIMAQYS
jgi:hypothetical protein